MNNTMGYHTTDLYCHMVLFVHDPMLEALYEHLDSLKIRKSGNSFRVFTPLGRRVRCVDTDKRTIANAISLLGSRLSASRFEWIMKHSIKRELSRNDDYDD